jgi:predicted kinase
MPKLVFLRGLPASGKSLYAAKLVAQGYKRINFDDLRISIDNGAHSKSNEKFIHDTGQAIAALALQTGYDVVYDNTNFAAFHYRWAVALCRDLRCELEVVDIDTPVQVCIDRDLARTSGRVGKDVITDMYYRYFKDGKFPGV